MELNIEAVAAYRHLIARFERLAEDTGDEAWTRAAGVVEREIRDSNGCPYTHSHTRDWCGRAGCRES